MMNFWPADKMFDEGSLLLLLLIFAIAGLYSSVGHGGASGYLAVLAIMGVSTAVLRPSALMLNLCVSAIAFIGFAASGHFRWKLFWPFAVGSIPMAFIGAGIVIDPAMYKQLLALCLLFAVARMFGLFRSADSPLKEPMVLPAIAIGAAIGMLSGVIGIGGGIILSPVLLLLRWCNAHQAAATSALFILVNSAAGLMGLIPTPEMLSADIIAWLAAALAGGSLGSYIGARRSSDLRLRHVLGTVLLFASLKLFMA